MVSLGHKKLCVDAYKDFLFHFSFIMPGSSKFLYLSFLCEIDPGILKKKNEEVFATAHFLHNITHFLMANVCSFYIFLLEKLAMK